MNELLLNNLETYRALRDKINTIGMGITYAEQEEELEYLSLMFTPEDAKYFANVSIDYDLPENVAERMGIDAGTAADHLYEMSKRGLLYREKVDGVNMYKAIPLLHGIIEFNVNNHTPEQTKAWLKIAVGGGGMRTRYYGYEPLQRSMPIRPEAVKDGELLPEDDIRSVVRNAEKIAVANCVCSSFNIQGGGECRYPRERCLAINGWADYYVENEDGRYISNEEALAILDRSDELGLSVHCSNSHETEMICNCCTCCCGLIRAYKTFPDGDGVKGLSNYTLDIFDDKCIGCGICEQRCPMDAIKIEEGKLVYDAKMCNGCGLCVTKCPEKALILERKQFVYLPKGQTWFDTYKIIAKDRQQAGAL